MSDSAAELKQVVEQEMSDWRVPGISVGIFNDGETHVAGFGVASVETGFPMRADTVLQIGSISKVFTASLAMTLVEDGKLELDTPVIKYMPDLQLQDKSARQALTMRHLLTHTSGLFGDWLADFGPGDDSLNRAIANIHTLRQIAPPGEVWSYCNSGFYIAGAVIERLSGQSFEQVMRERVFDPIGMEKATYFAHEAIVHPVSVGHNLLDDKQVVARRYPLPRNVNAAGGIIADAGEMLRFARMHLRGGEIDGKRVLSPESAAEMQREQVKAAVVADYCGLGWALRYRDGKRLVGHGGGTNGFRSYLTTVPEDNFAIVMLTNGSQGVPAYQRIEKWALETYCGVRDIKPEPVTLSTEQLERLAGRYEQQLHKITISVRDGGLQIDVIDRHLVSDEVREVPLAPKFAYPTSDRDFITDGGPDDGQHLDFVLDQNAEPTYFRYHGRVSEPVNR